MRKTILAVVAVVTGATELIVEGPIIGDDRCGDNRVWNQKACACFSLIQCAIYCVDGHNDPLSGCGCISDAEY